MLRSEKRILTTHAGSLPRPRQLGEMFGRLSRGEATDEVELERLIEESTRRVVTKQMEAGIDVGNNGEQPRESFFTYVRDRMSGFGGRSERPRVADMWAYPSYLEMLRRLRERMQVDLFHAPKAVGEVKYTGRASVEKECDNFLRINSNSAGRGFAEAFMTSASPGIIGAAMQNEHYPTLGDYLTALADALRVEYETIVSRGLILQIDAPDLALEHHTSFAGRPLRDFLDFVEIVVAAINRALQNVPADCVRLHVCWGNYEGPHNRDVALNDILPLLLKARVGAMLLSMANPRHEHEYRCFERHRLPAEMILIAGVVDSTTNYIEHPEVVADRLERVANAIGDRHRVMASPDCGFETTSGLGSVAEELVWEKLSAMRDGAAIASRRLFG